MDLAPRLRGALLGLVVALALAGPVAAQGFPVTGQVVSADDRLPLPGVNVVVAGTTIGAATDVDGRYSLTVPSETDSLQVSFVGYETQVIPVLGRTDINISLSPRNYGGNEVVVIGYGTSEVRDLTGSVGAVTAEEIEGRPLVSFEDALAGRVAGVNVQQNSGDLQGNFQIDIRGVGSFGSTNRPLYIVDGIPLEPTDNSFLSTLNTEDIESISVLKDASSASIYGVRAADGVVIITTKTGAGQKPAVEFSTEFDAASPVRQLDMLNSAQLAQYRLDAVRNSQGANPTFELPDPLQDPAFLAANDTDWQDAVTQTGLSQRYNVSARGSSGPIQFATSGNFENIQGRLIGSNIKRGSIRVNSVVDLSRRATLDVRLNGSRQWGDVVANDQTFGGSLRDALYKYPWETPYNDDGTFAEYDVNDPELGAIYSQPFPQNPVADLLENERARQWQQVIATTALTFRLPFDLRYRGSASANLSSNTADDFFPTRDRARQMREVVSLAAFDQLGYNYFTDHTLTYDREFGPHDVEVLGGMSVQEDYLEFTFAEGSGGTNNAQAQISLQPTRSGTSAREQTQRLLSYFSRVTYDYADKYFVTGTVRADGASKFSPERRWATLPAVGLAWRISNEPFLRGVSVINDLKLRASYGLLGDRAGVGDNAFLTRVSNGFVAFGENPVQQTPLLNIALPDGVGWETIRQLDIGFDLTAFRGRLGLTADYYHRYTEDVLGSVPAPPAYPVGSVSGNVGAVTNQGFEFALSATPLDAGRFTWRSTTTFGYNTNEVDNIREDVLGESGALGGRNLNDGPLQFGTVNQTAAGRPIGELWAWDFVGICSTDQYDPATNSCAGLTARGGVNGVQPGDTIYRDVNGDGIIDDADRVFLGSGLPKIFGGLTNVFGLGAFEVETLFTYAFGRKLFDTSLMFGISGDSNINKRAEVLDRWTPENQDTDIPRAFQGRRGYINALPSDFFIQSADFVRLRTLRVTYTLPGPFASVVGASAAQISVIGTNLLTFTDYSGYDPEASSGNRSNSGNLDAASAPLSPGLDLTTYPIAKTVGVRLNVTL
ncbi:SusC/RagA family TonB-linked outer membrane protein [Rubrivirga sp.]|uniref:SusC/RagA family TonB-linked outer membrane protein n=1 Tax=Rubrivirga sp. TaxID=1885344 RepID=UPI003B521C7A